MIVPNGTRFATTPSFIIDFDKIGMAALSMYTVLSLYADKDGYCYPSTDTLAERMKITRQYVSKLIKQLEDAGFLHVVRTHKSVNRYVLVVQNPNLDLGQEGGATIVSGGATIVSEGATIVSEGATIVDSNYNQLTKINRTKDTPNPLKGAEGQIVSLDAKKKEVKASETSTKLTDGFNAFWAAYPKRTDKGRARGAFKAAVGRLEKEIDGFDPSYLVFYAEIYAQKMKQEKTENKYIKHPTTWLNADALYDYEIEGNLPAPGEYRAQQAQKRQQKKQEPVNHMTYGIFD